MDALASTSHDGHMLKAERTVFQHQRSRLNEKTCLHAQVFTYVALASIAIPYKLTCGIPTWTTCAT